MSKISIGKYDMPPVYMPLLRDKSFIKLLYGSRNSAKSHAAALLKLIRAIEMPYFKCLMVRKIKDSVKESIYETLREVAIRHKIDHLFDFNDHKTQITCLINGNRFIPKGTHETLGSGGNAKSVTNPTDAIIDEMDEVTESEFKSLILSIRGCDDLEVIGIFNTNRIDEDHWIFKRWFPPTSTFEKPDGSHTYIPSKRSNTLILHTNYIMNPFVSKQIVEEFLYDKKFDPDYYELDGLGMIKTIKTTNMALKYYNPKIHVSDEIKFNPNSVVYLSWDFNRLPHHTVGLSQFGGYDASTNRYYWHLVKEFCLEDHSIDQTQEAINKWLKANKYSSNRVVIVCDYSGNTKRDHGTASDIARIKKRLAMGGYTVIDKSIVNPSVTASLDFLNSILQGRVAIDKRSNYPGATLTIRMHKNCIFHCDDFKKTKTDREGKILKVVKKEPIIEDGVRVLRSFQIRGHAVDGQRYLFTSIFSSEYTIYKSSLLA